MNYSVQIQRLLRLLHQRPPPYFTPRHIFQLHSQLITTGLHSRYPSLLLPLLQYYLSNSSTLPQATTLFHHIQEPNTTLKWLLMIRRYASDTSNPSKALSLFREMQKGSSAQINDPFIYASLIKACSKLQACRDGKALHCYVMRRGLDLKVNILNSLLSFYMCSVSLVDYANVLFDRVTEKNVVTVNSMLTGYVKRGDFDLSLRLFAQMLSRCFGYNVMPNHVTMLILISGCVESGELVIGRSLHCYCCKIGLDLQLEICNVLMDMYAEFECAHEAKRLFRAMPQKDLVSWNTMISGYAKSGLCRKAYALFKEMRNKKLEFDRISLINVILASANSRDLRRGKEVHGHMKVMGTNTTVSVGTALISMYSRCREIESAKRVFEELPKNDIICWNSMIHGYVECGLSIEALKLFDQIRRGNIEVDQTTMLGLILACRDAGDLNRGTDVHSYVRRNDKLNGNIVLGNALIDMYAKCGSMNHARTVLDEMPRRDVISWTSTIIGYAINGEGKKALAAFELMGFEKISPNSVTFIGVLLACDHAGLIDDGQNLYRVMREVYHIRPQIEHCGCVVDMYARAGKVEDAYQFIKTMPVEPNAVVWRVLINACAVHRNFGMGLTLTSVISELNMFSAPEDRVVSSNLFAEAGKWDDVLFQRKLMVAQKALKVAGRSSLLCLTG